jgi:hypothetical protein
VVAGKATSEIVIANSRNKETAVAVFLLSNCNFLLSPIFYFERDICYKIQFISFSKLRGLRPQKRCITF